MKNFYFRWLLAVICVAAAFYALDYFWLIHEGFALSLAMLLCFISLAFVPSQSGR